MRYVGPRGLPLSEFLSWPEQDQDAALAWQGHEARRCGTCGHHPDNGRVHAHVDICPGCAAREAVPKEDREMPGAHIRLAPGTADRCPRCREDKAAARAERRRAAR